MKKNKSVFGFVESKSVHFIGIGGIGVSSLAHWFRTLNRQSVGRTRRVLAQKWSVSGSDSVESIITRNLKKDGFKVKIGHKKGLLGPKAGLVIYSNAVKPGNPEMVEAWRRGIPVMSYPEAVGVLTRHYRTFGVAGAHGKSTTTALLSLVLIKAGWDPTVIVGTKLKEFAPPAGGKNFRLGRSPYLVLEADEWKGAFWNYSPFGAIITNVDKEHLDFYKNFGNIEKSFLKYAGNIQTGGILVLNRDNAGLRALGPQFNKIAKRNNFKLVWYSLDSAPLPLVSRLKNNLSIPGRHNLGNAMAVYVLARNLGIPENKILSALKSYHGAWRRMEFRGDIVLKIENCKLKIPTFDDYAHHPTEIKATLEAFRGKYPESKIVCVFQPHQAHRLKVLFKEFTTAFRDTDALILLPIYKVAGRDKLDKRYTSEALAKKIPGAIYLSSHKKLKKVLKDIVFRISDFGFRNSVVIMMGAGTVAEYTDALLSSSKRI